MKKLNFAIILICIISFTATSQVFAGNRDDITNTIPDKNTESQNQATALIQRLDEIKSMDKSNLNPAEKKELRTEVRSIKENLADISGGVYFSLGALVIIALVLILVL
ncbi:MAG: hypothetical protein IPG60_10245 [Bacteroidetes bacterium]|nr:hypothetical protein [Bacteroidota bacterium]MBK7108811.1 hypothetical protein [Bacteroidota bacterium]MBK8488862.1 hypothetical protein [Bacteroidota bacterium]MBK8680714.1 hypothetical protein [Bacteroidota bacterium]